MMRTYYIFLGIASIVSLVTGFLLSSYLFCDCKVEEGISLKDVGGVDDERVGDCDLYIDVSGAVMEPGVVCLDDGAIVHDAVEKAQGFNPSAYAFRYVSQKINLARILENEEKIYIPFRSDVVCSLIEDEGIDYIDKVMDEVDISKDVTVEKKEEVRDEAEIFEDEDCININTATKEKITELSGIGASRAADIIEGRPYSTKEDIKEVPGIGDVTFENIKDFICL